MPEELPVAEVADNQIERFAAIVTQQIKASQASTDAKIEKLDAATTAAKFTKPGPQAQYNKFTTVKEQLRRASDASNPDTANGMVLSDELANGVYVCCFCSPIRNVTSNI